MPSMPLLTEEEQLNELIELVFLVFELPLILIHVESCMHSFSYLIGLYSFSLLLLLLLLFLFKVTLG